MDGCWCNDSLIAPHRTRLYCGAAFCTALADTASRGSESTGVDNDAPAKTWRAGPEAAHCTSRCAATTQSKRRPLSPSCSWRSCPCSTAAAAAARVHPPSPSLRNTTIGCTSRCTKVHADTQLHVLQGPPPCEAAVRPDCSAPRTRRHAGVAHVRHGARVARRVARERPT